MSKEQIGIDWYNIQTGEEIITSRPAQIKALIESSDLGVNRKSDRGWRIGKKWFHKLEDAREDREFMEKLYEKYGEDVSDANIMVALFQQELRAQQQAERRRNDAPFEKEYEKSLRSSKKDK